MNDINGFTYLCTQQCHKCSEDSQWPSIWTLGISHRKKSVLGTLTLVRNPHLGRSYVLGKSLLLFSLTDAASNFHANICLTHRHMVLLRRPSFQWMGMNTICGWAKYFSETQRALQRKGRKKKIYKRGRTDGSVIFWAKQAITITDSALALCKNEPVNSQALTKKGLQGHYWCWIICCW